MPGMGAAPGEPGLGKGERSSLQGVFSRSPAIYRRCGAGGVVAGGGLWVDEAGEDQAPRRQGGRVGGMAGGGLWVDGCLLGQAPRARPAPTWSQRDFLI